MSELLCQRQHVVALSQWKSWLEVCAKVLEMCSWRTMRSGSSVHPSIADIIVTSVLEFVSWVCWQLPHRSLDVDDINRSRPLYTWRSVHIEGNCPSVNEVATGYPRVETVVTGETRQYLENGKVRMLRSRQEISEMKERLRIIPFMDKTLASNRSHYLQLARALLKRDLVTLIVVDEVREHVGVFLYEKPWKDTQRRIIDARVSNMHSLPQLGVSLVTSDGQSRVEVALENDDEDPGELSNMAGLHFVLADVKDAFHRFKISKLYTSFFWDARWGSGSPLSSKWHHFRTELNMKICSFWHIEVVMFERQVVIVVPWQSSSRRRSRQI